VIVIGHKLIDYPNFFRIEKVEAVHNSSPKDVLFVEVPSDYEAWSYLSKHKLAFASVAKSIKEAIFLNALDATYIIVSKNDASRFQKIANEYLFDSKILAIIESEDEIEDVAEFGVDGVIFKGVLDGEL